MGKKDKKIAYAMKKNRQKQALNCQNKKRYSSPVDAIAAAIVCKECREIKHDLFYYKCILCSGHHLTKVPGGDSVFAA